MKDLKRLHRNPSRQVIFVLFLILQKVQGSGAWPYAGLSLLKVKENLIVIQMVHTLHTCANILHIYIHKNVLTMF